MRVNVSTSLHLLTAEGTPFPTAGFVNVFANAQGKLITGKKTYATEALAKTKMRKPQAWEYLNTIRLEEYIPQDYQNKLNEDLKKMVIQLLDARLAKMLGLDEEPQGETTALVKKPVVKAKAKNKVIVKKKVVAKKKKPVVKAKKK